MTTTFGSGGHSPYQAPVSVELSSPVYADATQQGGGGGGFGGGGGGAGWPSGSGGGASGSLGSSVSRMLGGARGACGSRASIDPSQPPERAPVVVHVPLPDLNRPIVAHLDANHQIVGTREVKDEEPMHI